VATILLRAIVVVAVAAIAAYVSRIGTPPKNITAIISISGADSGSTKLTIEHASGDPIRGAFVAFSSTDDNINADNWSKMEVKINGELVTSENAIFNGSHVTTSYDFTVGDVLVLDNLAITLETGDVITVIYTPANQPLARVTVP
jgi:FlaG/FlaF family flagellin (archaellin)